MYKGVFQCEIGELFQRHKANRFLDPRHAADVIDIVIDGNRGIGGRLLDLSPDSQVNQRNCLLQDYD